MRWRRWMVAVLMTVGCAAGPVLTSSPASAATRIPGAFVPLAQTELLDTHTGVGAPRAKVAGHASLSVQLLGRARVPSSGVAAARLEVTVFDTAAGGSVLVAGEPVVSFARINRRSNSIVVRPGAHGRIVITNGSSGSVDVSAVVLGYYISGSVTQPGMFHATVFSHLLDTTKGIDAPKALVGSGKLLTVRVAGHASVPSSGASAVVLNLSAFDATARGTAVAYEGDLGVPTTPSLAYRRGLATRALVTVPLAPDGTIKILNRGPGALDLAADVEGYYGAGIPLGSGALINRPPALSQDSPLSIGAGRTLTASISGYLGYSPSAVSELGIYVSSPSQSGSIGVWTNGSSRPPLGTMALSAGSSAFAEVPVRASNYLVSIHNYSSATVHLTVDEHGFFSDGTLGAITGTVRDAAGHPLPGVRVAFGDDSSTAEDAATAPDYVTGANGRYQILGLSAGSYAVCFNPSHVSRVLSATGFQARCYDQASDNPTDVTLAPRQVVTGIDASLPVGGQLTGHVTDTGGHPLAGIKVQAAASGSLSWTPDPVVTSATGYFRIDGLDDSQYYNTCSETGRSSSTGSAPAGYVGACASSSPLPAAGTSTDVGTIAMYPAVGVSGTVTDAAGHPLANVGVGVGVGTSGYTSPSATTDSHGHYVITGIDAMAPPNTQHVYVCFLTHYWNPMPAAVSGGTSTTGYVDQCYNHQLPNASTTAPQSTAIDPAPGAIATHIDGSLAAAAAITGTVRNSAGHPLSGINVYVSTSDLSNTTSWQSTTTATNGTYRLNSLAPGTYSVCFVPTPGDPVPPPTGYLSQCWPNLPPRGAPENVTLTNGQVDSHIDGTLNAGGSISGVVTDGGGGPLQGVSVTVDGQPWATTDASGRYTASFVEPGSHSVCFDATSATGGSSPTGYQSQCWNAQAFGSPGTPVSVTVGQTTTGISPMLPSVGGIIVHVTDTSGNPLSGAPISVFVGDQTSNGVTYSATGSDGTYTVTHLASGQYTVCVRDTSGISGGTSTTGYQPQCYGQTSSTPSTPITVGSTAVSITIELPAV